MSRPVGSFEVLTGHTYGTVTIGAYHGRNKFKQVTWDATCVCGWKGVLLSAKAKQGKCVACGLKRKGLTKHGDSKKGAKHKHLYDIWRAIKDRIYNPRSPVYKYYGGRGLQMHTAWCDDYVQFRDYVLTELGERPANRSIDRMNNDEGYVPGNLRWATMREQLRNRSNAVPIDIGGETHTMREWAEIYDVPLARVQSRYYALGWRGVKLFSPRRSQGVKRGDSDET